METITFKYTFGNTEWPSSDEDGKTVRHDTTISNDVLFVGEVVEAFQNFLSNAYGYPITLEYNTHSDGSKQVSE